MKLTYMQEYIDRVTKRDFVTNEAGDEVFWPTDNRGYYDSFTLRTIADELDKMNGPWNDRIEEYFETQEEADKDTPDFRRFCVGCGFEHGPVYPDCVWNKDIEYIE